MKISTFICEIKKNIENENSVKNLYAITWSSL